jgi:hypothetical protein
MVGLRFAFYTSAVSQNQNQDSSSSSSLAVMNGEQELVTITTVGVTRLSGRSCWLLAWPGVSKV